MRRAKQKYRFRRTHSGECSGGYLLKYFYYDSACFVECAHSLSGLEMGVSVI